MEFLPVFKGLTAGQLAKLRRDLTAQLERAVARGNLAKARFLEATLVRLDEATA
jgi:hypothetical protein